MTVKLNPERVAEIRATVGQTGVLAERFGVSKRAICDARYGRTWNGWPERVPNEPFRRRFEELQDREGLTFSEVARRAGWTGPKGGDTSYVQRLLGYRKWNRGKGYGPYGPFDWMSRDAAVKLCEALDMDPVDAGL